MLEGEKSSLLSKALLGSLPPSIHNIYAVVVDGRHLYHFMKKHRRAEHNQSLSVVEIVAFELDRM
jgi:hypothetical protein